jgi:hypothetical protein
MVILVQYTGEYVIEDHGSCATGYLNLYSVHQTRAKKISTHATSPICILFYFRFFGIVSVLSVGSLMVLKSS